MITIPEGMGLEQFGLSGRQKVIRGVKGKFKGDYLVPPGLISRKVAADKDWDYTAAREGQPAARMRVADINLVEKKSRQKYLKIAPANSVDLPQSDRMVKVVGPNMIAPAGVNPDFVSPKGKVLDFSAEDIMAKDNVNVLPLVDEFDAEVDAEDVPGFDPYYSPYSEIPGGSIRQLFPAKSDMQAPDKILYRNPSGQRPSWKEREQVHYDYDKEGEEEGSSDPEMSMGILRVSESEDLGQWDVIATVAAAALTAGATGYKAYADIQRAKDEKKAAKDAAAAQAAQTAAMFNQQYGQQVAQQGAQQYAPIMAQPGPQIVYTPQGPVQVNPSINPYSTNPIDWNKILIFGGAGLALVGVAYILLK